MRKNYSSKELVCPLYSEEMYWLIASMAFESGNYDKAAQYYETYLRFFGLSEEKKALAQERWDEARFLIEMYESLFLIIRNLFQEFLQKMTNIYLFFLLIMTSLFTLEEE